MDALAFPARHRRVRPHSADAIEERRNMIKKPRLAAISKRRKRSIRLYHKPLQEEAGPKTAPKPPHFSGLMRMFR